jgi:ABC-type multidrug transport system ATPase subunit
VVSMRIKDLWFSYNNDKSFILKSLNLQIKKSETIGILGINGSGKTTLLKILCGILTPSQGMIEINETKIKGVKQTKELIAYVPENARLFLIGPTLRADLNRFISDKEHVEDIIRRYNFEPIADKKLYHLSEGQRRLMAILVAFQMQRDIILLDEPTIALDINGRNLLFHLIKEAKLQNRLVLVSTNDPRVFPRLNNLLLLHNGIFALHGASRDVLYNIERISGLLPNQTVQLLTSLKDKINDDIKKCITIEELNSAIRKKCVGI